MEKLLEWCPNKRKCDKKDCTDCFAFWCYEFGYCEGARQAIRAMNSNEPILLKTDLPLYLQNFSGAEELERIKRELGN